MSLSPAFATLTDNVNRKPFVCHSYKKTGGWGIRNAPHSAVPRLSSGCSFDRSAAIVPLRTHSNTRNSNSFMRLLHDSLDTPGVGSCRLPRMLARDDRLGRVRSRLPLRQKPARNIQLLPLLPYHLGKAHT